jgi:hypothetical protein
MIHDPGSQHCSVKHRAALRFAKKIPIFACKPDKTPYTPHGHLDATTDARRINAWWIRYPNANPAAPTGERSGFFVLDVDLEAWGAGSLEALETEYGELPTTYTVKTGGGGLHYYFRLPAGVEIRNSAGKLGLGLDVRGEGGYVLLPTSTTQGAYEVLERHPIADAPAWLVELLREPTETTTVERPRRRSAVNPSADGAPIPEGARDETLASIAGRLHDGTRSLSALETDLMEINEARCVPPLPERQVRKIASSIHKRTPCKPCPPSPSAETLEALDAVEAAMWWYEWRGMGGKSERDALIALIKQARQHGELIGAGVRVSISVRALALAAAVSKRAMLDSWKHGERKPGIISRLKRAGFIRSDNNGRGGTQAGGLVLLVPRARFHHSTTREVLSDTQRSSGEALRAPFTAPRLRWSVPSGRPRRGVVRGTRRVRRGVRRPPREQMRRLGKACGQAIDALEILGGSASDAELADTLRVKRPRDLRRRVIPRLEAAGVVECADGIVSLAPAWLDALNRDRERAGELEAHRRDMRAYNQEREAYRNRHKGKAERSPTEREMQERRESAPEARRAAVKSAIVCLFRERPDYRRRRVGQITCALVHYLPGNFPRAADPGGPPKDGEVAAILESNGCEVAS